MLVNVLQIGLVFSAEGPPGRRRVRSRLADPPAAFALALPMIGTTCIGIALAAHASGLTPAWQRVLGLMGSCVAAGLGNLAIAAARR